jgi:shikimate dehydrogenase
MLTGRTKLLGVIGHPVGHTLSPRMHNAAFAADGADYAYLAMDVAPERLAAAVEGLSALGFLGFNVTMPHKEAMLPLVDEFGRCRPSRRGGKHGRRGRRREAAGVEHRRSGFVEACAEADVSLSGRRVLYWGPEARPRPSPSRSSGRASRGCAWSTVPLRRLGGFARGLWGLQGGRKLSCVP